MRNYDLIAGFYDTLSGIVFRGKILCAQQHYLSLIKTNNRVLIIGGGTGQVLENFNYIGFPLTIDFVEPSGRMIKKARQRQSKLDRLNLNFIQEKFENIKFEKKYDFVCCFFFLDLFDEPGLKEVVQKVETIMTDTGYLLVSDFQVKKNIWWQKWLSAIMHSFFKLTTKLESKSLKDINGHLTALGFRRTEIAEFFYEFIFSAVYKKNVFKNGNHS